MRIIIILIGAFLVPGVYTMAQDSQSVKASADRGKAIYEQSCLACHQADGSGIPNLAPPLVRGMFVSGDKAVLVRILLEGLQGVEINGEYYANPMPAFDYLGDAEIADVLTYIRGHFTNDASAISREEAKAIRDNQSVK